MDYRIDHFPAMRLACYRHVGPYDQITHAWEQLMKWAEGKNLFNQDTKFLSIFHDCPDTVPQDQLRSDACITVDESFVPEDGITVQTIPGGTFAVYRYKGPYEGLGEAWRKLCSDWIPSRGLSIREGVCFEVYLNNPDDTPADELLTDVCEPVHLNEE